MTRARIVFPALAGFLFSTLAFADEPIPTPAPKPSKPGEKRYVLVQVEGPRAETGFFVPRFLSEADDRVPMGDASLAGARLVDLKSDPNGAAAKAFREQWPADVWVGLRLDECRRKVHQTTVPGFPDPITGARTYRTETTVEMTCPALVTLVDAASAKEMSSTKVEGHASSDPQSENAEVDPIEAAAHDAAERAAKKAIPRAR
jgi:hypothetical protein